MNHRRVHGMLSLGCLIALASQTGCMTAVKTAYYEVRGAKVKVVPARESVPRNEIIARFAPYKAFTFEPAATTLGEQWCPQRVLSAFDTEAANLRSDEGLGPKLAEHYPGGEPTLTISSDVQFVESKGVLGSALLFARVRMADGDKTVLDALVITKSHSFREGGREELAMETAKGLGRFLINAKTGEKDLDEMLP